MRTGIILLILLVIAFAHLANPAEISISMLVVFGFAVMVGATGWRAGAIILAAIVTLNTGISNIQALALNLAPIGFGVVIGAALQHKPGGTSERVEPVRAIPVSGERGARSDADPRRQRRDTYRRDENQGLRGPLGGPTSHRGAGTGTDE